MKLIPKVRRFHGRDIVRVLLDSGEIQPFYRSSGKNSRLPGAWLPFDGIQILRITRHAEHTWMDKQRFTERPSLQEGTPLHRYGTDELKQISEALGSMDIAEGQTHRAQAINKWLGTKRSMEWHRYNKTLGA